MRAVVKTSDGTGWVLLVVVGGSGGIVQRCYALVFGPV